MTIGELIERLEEMRESYGEDCEVRLMTQENWPFENSILGVTMQSELPGEDDEEDDDDDDDYQAADDDEDVCYIVEGMQLGYGNKSAWNVCM